MKQNLAFKILGFLAVSTSMLPLQAGALPMPASQKSGYLIAASADCAIVGERVAASQGGQLAKATSAVQNGRPMCVIVVLIPGREGERPRRVEVAVAAD